jgi:hypothetical protein
MNPRYIGRRAAPALPLGPTSCAGCVLSEYVLTSPRWYRNSCAQSVSGAVRALGMYDPALDARREPIQFRARSTVPS